MSGVPPDKPPETDNDGFVVPTVKRGRGRPRKKRLEDDEKSILSDNSFGTLTDDDEMDSFGAPIRVNVSKKPRETKTKKPPPLIVRNLGYKDVQQRLAGSELTNITKRITKAGTKLYVSSTEEHRALRNHLDQSRTKYTTYTLDDDKFSRYVMYGLPSHTPEEIKLALTDALKIPPTEVKSMKMKKKQYDDQANYLIYFKKGNDVTIRDLQRVTGILGFHVFFRRYQRSNAPCQCYNCQEFTHASKNCTLDPRCNRCAEAHKSADCDKIDATTKKVPDKLLKCCNCNGNHTASSRICPERLKLIKKRDEMISQRATTETRTKYVRQFNNYNTNFPSFLRNSTAHENNVNKPSTSYSTAVRMPVATEIPGWQNSPNNLLKPSQLMQIFREIVNICTTCKSKHEQLTALSTIVEKYVLDD